MKRYCCPYVCDDTMKCDVSNEADILTTHIGQAISIGDNEIKNDLIEISHMMFDFMREIRQQTGFSSQNVSRIEEFESKYKDKITSKVIFVIPTGTQLAAILHTCRVYAKKLARMYWKLEVETGIENDEMSNFVNVLSTTFHQMAKYTNQLAGVEELEVKRRK